MDIKVINCFIASPSDTNAEREICEKVFSQLNNTAGKHFNCRIESKRWEKDVRPGFGEDGQDVINKQINNDYDLFLGIMWKRFGTRTNRADSGTEEEFNLAFERFQNKDDIEIMFYFSNEKTSIEDINPEQLLKVNQFKDKISTLGGLYSKYDGIDDFEAKLRDHIYQYLSAKFSSSEKKNDEDLKKLEQEIALKTHVGKVLTERLNKALCSFSKQPIIWVDPVVSKTDEISQNPDDNFNNRVDLKEFIASPKSVIFKSPPQFGLTCLAHFLVKEAWDIGKPWVYLDCSEIKPHNIDNFIKRETIQMGVEKIDIQCIVLDSFDVYDGKSLKILKNISNNFENIPIIAMQAIDDAEFGKEPDSETIEREFEFWHLLALPRAEIRKVVTLYNKEKNIGDDDKVLTKVIKDLESLNIHRTPYNCFTLLKVSERYFDESPVNRTQMVEMVLFVLFNFDDIPTYTTKPDLKDCEYVLGRFCEDLIRSGIYTFSKDRFINELEKFCSEKLIKLDLNIVFEVLNRNNILVYRDNGFTFRSTFWIFFFGAKRMHIDKQFAEYILKNKKYTEFPEIIEFYTGIDRNREDALNILLDDIKETSSLVQNKVGLPEDMNPFSSAVWKPTQENITKIQNEISEDVIKSKLPSEIRDQYADKKYDQIKPYHQTINNILEEYSLVLLIQRVKASSKALRNSDYVGSDLKRELLGQIINCWEQISNVLVALIPNLAADGEVAIEGASFNLIGNFGVTVSERINRIFQVIPFNIVVIFKDDLFSPKIAPLLYSFIDQSANDLKKHELILLVAYERPEGWKNCIEKYIVSVSTNSFYLYSLVNVLRVQYKYGFINNEDIRHITYLIKMGLAKHEFKITKPGLDKIRQIDNKNLPTRYVKEE